MKDFATLEPVETVENCLMITAFAYA
jgi:hypothetical protein